MVTFTLTPDQERRLTLHAAARNCTPAEAFNELLDAAPPARRAWTEYELTLLRNPANAPRDIARITGRSTTSPSPSAATSLRRTKASPHCSARAARRTGPGCLTRP